MIYLHDGLFDGFLTCIYEHYYTQPVIGIYSQTNYSSRLFEDTKLIQTDKEKATKVYNAIITKLSEPVYWDIFYTFLSDDLNKDCYLLNYIVKGFKMGKDIHNLHTQEVAYIIKRISRRVSFERHRFLGLLRFMDTGYCLYAPLEPDNDILMSLAEHFVDRFRNEKFIIHDLKRNKAIISNRGKWVLTDFMLEQEMGIDNKREAYFQELWRNYFEAIGIESRENPKLQQNFVPLKYRKHIVEFSGKKNK